MIYLSNLALRISSWVLNTFGSEILMDEGERASRVLEEAVELAQSCNVPVEKARLILERTYSRPVGEKPQEAAGVFVTLFAWVFSQKWDSKNPLYSFMDKVEREVQRLEFGEREKFRRKQREKFLAGTGLRPHDD